MERVVIEVNSSKNTEFLLELLKKFDFINSIKKEKSTKKSMNNKIPIEWAKNNADIMALAGIWKDKPRTIEKIREKAWKRN
jgi:ribosomal protein S8